VLDINQYDISDPVHPKLTARLFTGGSIRAGSGVTVTDGEFKDAQPDVKPVKGVTLQGGPQMIQLRCAAMQGNRRLNCLLVLISHHAPGRD
jgi:hypothetical protein